MGYSMENLGLVLTRGELCGYCVENQGFSKNDRGIFYLMPSPVDLLAGEETVFEWELFVHRGTADFYSRLRSYKAYIEIQAQAYTIFLGENLELCARARDTIKTAEVAINGEGCPYSIENNRLRVCYTPGRTGECVANITINGI